MRGDNGGLDAVDAVDKPRPTDDSVDDELDEAYW